MPIVDSDVGKEQATSRREMFRMNKIVGFVLVIIIGSVPRNLSLSSTSWHPRSYGLEILIRTHKHQNGNVIH